jgi:DNA repair protein RadC
VLLLDRKNRIMREVMISQGSLTASVVHPREVFNPAIRDSAAAVICVHNHPSGDPQPSQEDRALTARLVEAGRLLGIQVLDHVIVGRDTYMSFADEGLLDNGKR